MQTQLTLSETLVVELEKQLALWKSEYPNYHPLDFVQQINYTSLFLRTLGSQLEAEYKKPFGKITNDLH